jgi:hypothetical protein
MLTKRLLIVIFVLAVVAALAIPAFMMRGTMKPPASLSPAMLQSERAGKTVDVVADVVSVDSAGVIAGILLIANADGTYSRSTDDLRIRVTSSTTFEMGSISDIRPGSFVAVRGVRTSARSTVDAGRVVILDGYLRLR